MAMILDVYRLPLNVEADEPAVFLNEGEGEVRLADAAGQDVFWHEECLARDFQMAHFLMHAANHYEPMRNMLQKTATFLAAQHPNESLARELADFMIDLGQRDAAMRAIQRQVEES